MTPFLADWAGDKVSFLVVHSPYDIKPIDHPLIVMIANITLNGIGSILYRVANLIRGIAVMGNDVDRALGMPQGMTDIRVTGQSRSVEIARTVGGFGGLDQQFEGTLYLVDRKDRPLMFVALPQFTLLFIHATRERPYNEFDPPIITA
jgi:hypothetical protein